MKKDQSGFSVVEVLLLIIIIGLIAGLGWFVVTRQRDSKDKSSSTPTTKQAQSSNASTLQPEEITAKIKNSYSSRYALRNLDENNQPKQGEMSIRISKASPPHKV